MISGFWIEWGGARKRKRNTRYRNTCLGDPKDAFCFGTTSMGPYEHIEQEQGCWPQPPSPSPFPCRKKTIGLIRQWEYPKVRLFENLKISQGRGTTPSFRGIYMANFVGGQTCIVAFTWSDETTFKLALHSKSLHHLLGVWGEGNWGKRGKYNGHFLFRFVSGLVFSKQVTVTEKQSVWIPNNQCCQCLIHWTLRKRFEKCQDFSRISGLEDSGNRKAKKKRPDPPIWVSKWIITKFLEQKRGNPDILSFIYQKKVLLCEWSTGMLVYR